MCLLQYSALISIPRAVVCFVGDENVSVASVILDLTTRIAASPEELRAKLELLRRNVPHPDSSDRPVRAQFGFMAGGCGTMTRDEVEKTLFAVVAELFPGVPFTGFGVYDLFGHDVLPSTGPRANAGTLNTNDLAYTVIAVISVLD